MANEKHPKQAREEKNGYERARRKLNKGGRTESVMAALSAGRVPENVDPLVRDFSKAVLEVSELPTTPIMDPNWNAIQERQMALGQKLQTLCNAILEDPDWRENFLKRLSPGDLLKMLDMGIKLERQAVLSKMEAEKVEEKQKESLGGGSGLAEKAMHSPVLLDALHDLYSDEDEEE